MSNYTLTPAKMTELARVNKIAKEWGVSPEAVTAAEELLTNTVPEYIEAHDEPPASVVRAMAKMLDGYLQEQWQAGYDAGRDDARAGY